MDPFALLAVAEGCGQGMIPQLLDPDADPHRLLEAPPHLPPAVARRIADPALGEWARARTAAAQKLGWHTIGAGSRSYPEALRPLPLRPLLLHGKGDLTLLNDPRPAVAVVGSRTPTAYGTLAAGDFCAALARAGAVVWSGLAVGIDTMAHRAALDNGRPTVAVLAGGPDRIDPASNGPLARDIVAGGGLLLTEAPVGLRPQRGHFPRRNRIIAGATLATLVIEAGLGSGSLHTARFAAEAGRAVFAVPGPYTSPRSRGCHRLLADGAGPAADPAQLLRELEITVDLAGFGLDPALAAGAEEQSVLQVLANGPRPTDLVQRECRIERRTFLAVLDRLVRGGLVRALPGDLIGLARAAPTPRAGTGTGRSASPPPGSPGSTGT